jgi:hypothetical protein
LLSSDAEEMNDAAFGSPPATTVPFSMRSSRARRGRLRHWERPNRAARMRESGRETIGCGRRSADDDYGGAGREERTTDDSCAARGDIPQATALQPTKTMVPLMIAATKNTGTGRQHDASASRSRRGRHSDTSAAVVAERRRVVESGDKDATYAVCTQAALRLITC